MHRDSNTHTENFPVKNSPPENPPRKQIPSKRIPEHFTREKSSPENFLNSPGHQIFPRYILPKWQLGITVHGLLVFYDT